MRALRAYLQRQVRNGLLKRIPGRVKNLLRGTIPRGWLYDRELLDIGLDIIHPKDIFLCSFPRSGNTWLRFIIAHLQHPGSEINFRTIDRLVPEISRCPFDLNQCPSRPVMKTHWPYLQRYPKLIYIHRDPRDVLLSYYHYCVNNQFFSASLNAFIRSPVPNFYRPWNVHVEAAFEVRAQRPESILVLSYEQMLADPAPQISRLADFLEIRPRSRQLAGILDQVSFMSLRQMEHESGGETQRAATGFFRQGRAGQYARELGAADIHWIETQYASAMRAAGYL